MHLHPCEVILQEMCYLSYLVHHQPLFPSNILSSIPSSTQSHDNLQAMYRVQYHVHNHAILQAMRHQCKCTLISVSSSYNPALNLAILDPSTRRADLLVLCMNMNFVNPQIHFYTYSLLVREQLGLRLNQSWGKH